MKSFLLFSMLIFITASLSLLSAQEFNIGLIAGYSENNFVYKEAPPDSINLESSSGYSAAFLLEYFEYEYAAFQTGLRFSKTGGIIQNIDSDVPNETLINLTYLYIPLTAKLSTKTNPDIYGKLSLEGGFLLSAESVVTYPDGKEDSKDFSGQVSSFSYNGLMGLGASYKIDNVLILFEVDWSKSFTGIFENEDQPKIYTSETIYNLGIMIDLAEGYGTSVIF